MKGFLTFGNQDTGQAERKTVGLGSRSSPSGAKAVLIRRAACFNLLCPASTYPGNQEHCTACLLVRMYTASRMTVSQSREGHLCVNIQISEARLFLTTSALIAVEMSLLTS